MCAKIVVLAVVAYCPVAASWAYAQTTTMELTKVSGREYLHHCGDRENALPCLGAVYSEATVNRLLDVIKHQRTFCPPPQGEFPPSDIVARVTEWLRAHPLLLDRPSSEGLSEALKAFYPCR